MRIRQVIRNSLARVAASAALMFFISLAAPAAVQAIAPAQDAGTAATPGSYFAAGKKSTSSKTTTSSKKGSSKKGGGGGGGGGGTCSGSSCSPTPTGGGQNCNEDHCDLIALYINPLIQLLGLLVGLVAAGSLVMGGIQYISSSGDPQKTGAAKSRISNTLLAFVAFLFLYAFLNFLIPGGLFQ